MRVELDLKKTFYLVFWLPFFLLLILIFWYPLKAVKFFQPLEVKLPDVYATIYKYALGEKKDLGKEALLQVAFEKNPFYTPKIINGNATEKIPIKNTLQLTSILQMERKICVINGKLYKEGDTLGNIKIKKVGDYYVVLLLPNNKKVLLEVGATYSYSD